MRDVIAAAHPPVEAMSKATGGSESASKGPRRRQPRRGPDKLDVFAEDFEPGGVYNPHPGEPLPSRAARSTRPRLLANALPQPAPPVPPVVQLLRNLGVGSGVPIDDSLKDHPTLVRALTMAAKPKPKVQDGNDHAAGAAALSLIIGCALQESRAQLVNWLLEHGLRTWPLVGCEFDHSSLRPPLLAALEAYETFADKAEWLKMFHALANRGDLDTYYGPKLLTASNVYFDKFQKNYEPVWADEDE